MCNRFIKIFLKEIDLIYDRTTADASNRTAIAVTGSPYLCFFFLLFLCRSFAFLTCDIGISASGTPIISSSSNASAPGAFEAIPRREGKYLDGNRHPRLARRSSRSYRVRNDFANETGRRKSRHASRYWRFVQVVRRPGRRRLQKHNHRRPDTDYRPERPRICQEGF